MSRNTILEKNVEPKNSTMNKTIRRIATVLLLIFTLNSFGQNAELSDGVINDMKYMLEEEKVARDVYEYLGDEWNLRIFLNIKQSEQRHFEMMENLLNTNNVDYQLSDERGVFYNEDLQKMYDGLVDKGSKSKREALEVGKLIEETDIKDLEEAIDNTDDVYIKQVYSNLLRASQKHLQAFNRHLSK